MSDKLGAVRVALGGTALYVLGLVLMATAAGGNQLSCAGALIGLGHRRHGLHRCLRPVARAAPPEKRASALGLTTMGSAIGQFVALPYVHAILDATGWVTSLFITAGTAALMAPLALQLGPGRTAAAQSGWISAQGLGAALSEAFRYPSFLLLTAGFFVCGFHIAAVAVHLPAFLADRGFGSGLGAIALTVVGGANILGTYAFGRIGDIVPKRLALAFIYLARAPRSLSRSSTCR